MPSPFVWTVTAAVLLVLFVFDFVVQARKPNEPSPRAAAAWCGVYACFALAFGAAMAFWWSPARATEFVAGYVTELSLSVDNLFVFLLIMGRGKVPRGRQQKVLLFGVAVALVARAVFIFLGAAVIAAFSWTFYVFGAYLVYIAARLALEDEAEPREDEAERDGLVARLAARLLPASPLLAVVVTLGFTDVLFALDSIPAVYGLTDQAYIVLTANAFALMGLIQMYFLLGGLLGRLVYLRYGLSAVLAFIGAKLILHAARESGLPAPEISTPVSLAVIASVLVVVVVASLAKTRSERK